MIEEIIKHASNIQAQTEPESYLRHEAVEIESIYEDILEAEGEK